jgi:hypothetical protein
VLLEKLGKLKNPMDLSGIECKTYRLAVLHYIQLRYRVLQNIANRIKGQMD